jgi:hypothetical protein
MRESFAGQNAVDFRLAFWPGSQRFGLPACQNGLITPVDRGEIGIVAQLHGVASVMHADREQQNDRQRNADQSKQGAFCETHRSLLIAFQI